MKNLLFAGAVVCLLLAVWTFIGPSLAQQEHPPPTPTTIVTPTSITTTPSQGAKLVGEPFIAGSGNNQSITTTPLPTKVAGTLPPEGPPSHEAGFLTYVGKPWEYRENEVPGNTTLPEVLQDGPPYDGAFGPGTPLIFRPMYGEPPESCECTNCRKINLKFSYYWPPLAGPNCAVFDFGLNWCMSKTSSHKPWEGWVGKGAAMPFSINFGSLVYIRGRVFEVVDRGGLIYEEDGAYRIDLLTTPDDRALNFGDLNYLEDFEGCLVSP